MIDTAVKTKVTLDILAELGFVPTGEGRMDRMQGFFSRYEKKDVYIWFNQMNGTFYYDNPERKFKYRHQLVNLYVGLTGEELETE